MQEVTSTSSAGHAAAADPDVEETGSMDDDDLTALENDAEASSEGSLDPESWALEHEEDETSTAPASGLQLSGGPAVRQDS